MKTVLLIGLGRFGRHIAMKMNELHHQVMAVDKNEERVEALLPYVTNAQIGDSTNEEFLKSLGVRNFDLCIVTIGSDPELAGDNFSAEGTGRKISCKPCIPRYPCEVFAAQRRR